MTYVSKILLATALALAIGGPAVAQTREAAENLTLAERNVYLFMDGKMVRMKAGDSTHGMIMKEFKPLKNGTMIYASGGKLYLGENKKMSSGKMLHAEIYGPDVCTSCN
jgi:hypothetical protein